MINAMPCQFTDVDQAICTTETNERPEVTQTCNGACDNLAFRRLGKQTRLLLLPPLLLCFTFTEDQTTTLLINFDYLHTEYTSIECIERVAAIITTSAYGNQM